MTQARNTDETSSSPEPAAGGSGTGGDLRAETQIFLRPIGSPVALGFLALAGASLALSGTQLGWFPPTETRYVALVLVAFAVPLELLASVFGFLARDSGVGTGMGILAGIWLTVALVKLASAPGATSEALGTFLIFAGAALTVPAIGAALGKLVAALVLLTAALRVVLTGIYQLTTNADVQSAAGVAGLVLVGLAGYAALALEIEDVRRKPVLPMLRLGAGKAAMHGTTQDQLSRITREAGVREQL